MCYIFYSTNTSTLSQTFIFTTLQDFKLPSFSPFHCTQHCDLKLVCTVPCVFLGWKFVQIMRLPLRHKQLSETWPRMSQNEAVEVFCLKSLTVSRLIHSYPGHWISYAESKMLFPQVEDIKEALVPATVSPFQCTRCKRRWMGSGSEFGAQGCVHKQRYH